MLKEANDEALNGRFAILKQSQICQAYVFTGELAPLNEAKAEVAEAFNSAANLSAEFNRPTGPKWRAHEVNRDGCRLCMVFDGIRATTTA